MFFLYPHSPSPEIVYLIGFSTRGQVELKSTINPPLPEESSPKNNPTIKLKEKKIYKILFIF